MDWKNDVPIAWQSRYGISLILSRTCVVAYSLRSLLDSARSTRSSMAKKESEFISFPLRLTQEVERLLQR
jgi:hypothetical protein